MCPDCQGYRLISSQAQLPRGNYNRVFCVGIPMYSCPTCQTRARLIYEQMINGSDKIDYIYLQDKVKDEYRSLQIAGYLETVL
jgi:hypothetical protein